MSMKVIDNTNATNANVTRGNVTRHKYTLTNISNTFQINQQQPAGGTEKYAIAQQTMWSRQISREAENENLLLQECFLDR